MKPGHVVLLVLGILLSLAGLALVSTAAFTGLVQAAQDDDGYLTSQPVRLDADSYALTSQPLDVVIDEELPPGVHLGDAFGFRLEARAAQPGQDVFIGIASVDAVDNYLAGVPHSQLADVEFRPFDADYRELPGTSEPQPPAEQDFWAVSEDPTVEGEFKPDIPPYYLSVAMPGQDEPTFSLTTTYIPAGSERQNLTGYLAVDADAGETEGQPREDYGKLRMLVLPRETTVRGPGQFQNEVNSSNEGSDAFDVTLSQFLNLNRQQGSQSLLVGGPAIVHTGSGGYVCKLLREKYITKVFAGNALATHDMEQAMFGTSLGVHLERGDLAELDADVERQQRGQQVGTGELQ